MPLDTYLLLMFAALIIGSSKGGLTSIGAISVPIMAFKMNVLEAAALLLPVYILSDLIGIYIYRKTFSLRNIAILIPAGFVGVVLATLIAPFISEQIVLIVTGLIGVTFCLRVWFFSARSKEVRPADVPRGLFWGILTGITSFVSHTGAAPFQAYVMPQHLTKLYFAGTTTITFAAINFAKLPAYWSIDLLNGFDLWLMLPVLGAAALGSLIGFGIVRVISEKHYRLFIQIALAILSARLIIVGVAGLWPAI